MLHNLKAHPETEVQIGPEVRRVRARLASEAERTEWWPRVVARYPGYEFYEQLAGDRMMPVVLLEPRA